jgi:hypothetical protein
VKPPPVEDLKQLTSKGKEPAQSFLRRILSPGIRAATCGLIDLALY